MKRILFACLLGTGLMLPSKVVKSSIIYVSRVVDIFIEGWVLELTSDSQSGTLSAVHIYNSSGTLVKAQGCSGYSCSVNVQSLPAGNYTAVATAGGKPYSEPFSL